VCFLYAGPAVLGQDRDGLRTQKILQIQQLIENRDLTGASNLLDEAKKQYPSDPGFDNLAGIVAAQQGNYAMAESSFFQAIKRSPKFTGAYLNLGRLYQENVAYSKAHQKALNIYERVLGYEPANAEANYQLAALLLRDARYRESLNHVSRLPLEMQRKAQTLAIKCADYAGVDDRRNADDAAALLATSTDFSAADALQLLPALVAAKRDDLLISLLEHLQSHEALSPGLERALGLAYERAGKLGEARTTLEKSVTKETLSAALLLELARVAHKQQDYQGSLGYLAHARDIEPNNANVHYSFGMVCVDLNLVAEARNSFEKAVKLDPENASYNYAMGATSVYRHDPAEAVPYFEKYLRIKPDDPRAKLALGDALFRAKDHEAAVPWLRQATTNPETAATAHYYLGSIALQERQLDEAQHEFEQALKIRPDYPDALAELGQYYLVRKDYTKAEKQIRNALRVDPEHFSANFYLLTLYTRTGDERQESQARHFEELKKLRDEKTQEFLRIVEVRPFETP